MGLEKLISIWNSIRIIGVKNNTQDALSLYLLNQIGVLGGIACVLMLIITLMLDFPGVYLVMVSVLGLTLVIIPILNFYHKTHISKFIIGELHPPLLCVFILISGGDFGENSIFLVSIFMIFILFREKPRRMFRSYFVSGIMYLGVHMYMFLYEPLFQVIDNPYDNFIAFIVCAVWLIMIIAFNQQQNNKQKEKQDNLIAELQTKNQRLKKTSEELEQFTYIASHDLKSPLRTIISFLDLIRRDVQRQRYDDLMGKLDFARSGAEQMNFLVTDILEYSKITNGKARKKKIVDLQTLIERVKFNLNDIIQRKNVDLYVFPLPKFYCNDTEMVIIFQNLIENGIKYNKEARPNVFVKAHLDDQFLTLQFIDNGIGIEEQYFEKIFLFFKRLHTSETYKGTGLGLGLCKKIIDDMGGTIKVDSTVSVGSTFTLKLPVERPEKPLQEENITEPASI